MSKPGELFQRELLKARDWFDGPEYEAKPIAFDIEAREPLDAIDLAYVQLEYPLIVLRVPARSTSSERSRLLRDIQAVTRYAVAVLPPGYDLKVIGPSYTCAPPFELARWADDGGSV